MKTLNDLLTPYAKHPGVKALAKLIERGGTSAATLGGLLCSSAPMVFAAAEQKRGFEDTILFVLNDAEEAGYFYHDLMQILGDGRVLFFPSSYRRAVKYGQKDPANEILRTEVLTRIQSGGVMVVTHPEALAELVVDKTLLNARTLSLSVGQEIKVDEIERTLLDFGFTEVDYVYEPGQFAMRGSLFDVFSYSNELPFRVDFFGDEIDSIRTFEVQTQLSEEQRKKVDIVAPPAAGARMSFLDFLPEGVVMVMKDQIFVRERIEQTYEAGFSQQALTERLESANEQERHAIMQEMRRESQLITGAQFAKDSLRFMRILLRSSVSDTDKYSVQFSISPQPLFHKNFDMLKDAIEDYRLNGYKLHILADSEKQAERLRDILGDDVFTPVKLTLHEGFCDEELRMCFFTDHQIFDRFHKYNLKSDRARSGKVVMSLKEINELQMDDYIVHVDHGIGRFGGLVRVPSPKNDGTYTEQVRILYQNNDVVFVSIHSLYKISKYKGKEGMPPKLSKLGTGAWERMKERTKTKLKDIARDLIRLYSKRRHERGFAFSGDTYMQHELEASFLYEDTPDQLKATQDVKADMEQAKPMDRLVCGDVGFGKTEVAVRAAFKAAVDGKQVAVLVPTTVLAYQHFQTFSGRLKDMPVRVEYLSRARSAKQTKEILADLADGKIDIVIGTHKLIGKNVRFKDLGLLIIDEEQKFGVSTKEKLRQLKANVDTLTMSATPIPRTLQFSLMGARDLSVIQTPPPNRYPIQTEVHTFSSEVIRDAVNFEMSRNGQVYIVTNRIANLSELQTMLHEQVPDARIAVGHGRMKPEELEDIIFGFANYDYDVLISTTIVENGIDIPNANTIIINQAHNFGLSDLHQMRGRVGRGNRKAFCYLLAPPKSVLPVESRRRLEAIENFSDLGSGIHLAMQDLDIRGAGNLLGAEQSGFIADLGFETYQKILNQAVAELRNEAAEEPESPENIDNIESQDNSGKPGKPTPQPLFAPAKNGCYVADCTLDTDIDVCFPELYVPSSSERILLYRQLDSLEDDDRLALFRTQLIDRFGPVPQQGEELMRIVQLRRIGKHLGVEKIVLKQGSMRLYLVQTESSPYYQSETFGRVINFAASNAKTCKLEEIKGKRLMRITNVPTIEAAIHCLQKI